jgi:hypothetical protein
MPVVIDIEEVEDRGRNKFVTVAVRTHEDTDFTMLNLIQEPTEPNYLLNISLNGSI